MPGEQSEEAAVRNRVASGIGRRRRRGVGRGSLVTIAGFVALFALGVGAQDSGPPPPRGNACKDDVARFCSDVKPGGGARIRCLKDHEDALSEACRAELAEHSQRARERAHKVAQACGDDAKRLCAEVTSGQGGSLALLAGPRGRFVERLPRRLGRGATASANQLGDWAAVRGHPPAPPWRTVRRWACFPGTGHA